jgi:hypothetical protein
VTFFPLHFHFTAHCSSQTEFFFLARGLCDRFPMKVACTHPTGLRCRRLDSDCGGGRTFSCPCHSRTLDPRARPNLHIKQDLLVLLGPIITSFNGFLHPPPVTLPCSYRRPQLNDVASPVLIAPTTADRYSAIACPHLQLTPSWGHRSAPASAVFHWHPSLYQSRTVH